MKKIWLILSAVLVLALALTGCGSDGVNIEGHKWELTVVQSGEDGSIVACGSEHYEMHKEIEDIIVVDLECSVENGKFTIQDKTNNKNYEGTYKLSSTTSDGAIYELTTASNSGMAVTANTEYTDHKGTKTYTPTLIITLGDYSMNFQDEK